MFDFFKKDKKEIKTVSAPVPMSTPVIDSNAPLEKKISLRKDIVVDTIKRKNISCDKARVIVVLDRSGSMKNLYDTGVCQDIIERILPMGMVFDDNEEIEFYIFHDTYKELPSVNKTNIASYMKNYVTSQKYGGTCYSPIMKSMVNSHINSKDISTPTYVIFVTDGDNFDSDKDDTKEILKQSSSYGIFWKFIGIGDDDFAFLKKLDNLKGRAVDNAHFVSIGDIKAIPDEKLYELLMEEYNDWLIKCKSKNILK